MKSNKLKPLGIRNNNPGNLEWGSPWQGLVKEGQRTSERFCQFTNPVDGIRAIARTLITYQDKRRALDGSRIDSIEEIVQRWAPGFENNVGAYAKSIAELMAHMGIDEDDEIVDVHNFDHLKPLVEGIIRHENGRGPLKTANTWYEEDVIEEALRRAGVVKKAPATKGLAGAASVGGLGVAQVADVAPAFFTAWQSAGVDVTSGDMVRIAFGVGTIAVAGYIAYTQYRKSKIAGAA